MHIANKDKCLFATWYGDNKLKIEILDKDDEFWRKEMEPKLVEFYMDCLLPELVDPRYPRKKTIRDPDYVATPKQKEARRTAATTSEMPLVTTPTISRKRPLQSVENISSATNLSDYPVLRRKLNYSQL